ncbi:G-protein coupled receptor [Biomphalaria glabrata]
MAISNNTDDAEVSTLYSSPTSVNYYYLCFLRTKSFQEFQQNLLLMCYVRPGMSILGIVANMFSLQILRRSGLHKQSNILLFSMVIADTLCLFRALNYGSILIYYGPNKSISGLCAYQYSETISYFLSYSFIITEYIHLWGEFSSTSFPVLITLERVIAIFRPMAFSNIVTRKRTIISVECVYLLWLPWTLFLPSLQNVSTFSIMENITFVHVVATNVMIDNIVFINVFDVYVNHFFADTLPFFLVVSGNIALGFKVHTTLRKRKELTTSKNTVSWSPRTTRTLMLTCLFFAATTLAETILQNIAFHTQWYLENGITLMNMGEIRNLILQIHSSLSFFIFIASNKHFMNIFCGIFRRQKK